MKCKNCGSELELGANFCTQCGAKVSDMYENTASGNEEKKDPVLEKLEEVKEEVNKSPNEKNITDKTNPSNTDSKDFNAGDNLNVKPRVSDNTKGATNDSSLIKSISLVAMVVMAIFAIIYLIDTFRLIFYSIGGIF
ncbi:zinc ribbon domain-containing protein [Anaerococcus vaginimassiliensis]|uniref:zinc ribbon domain-containing protein n=1 Tax=Anaerococcus vaginimassiliensis TaxID=2042308 RepID=UPI00102FB058|nr:zinc ribbon domain-containing protein [Anaerococcus vaginimassiliensis]